MFFQIVCDWPVSAEEEGTQILKEALADSDDGVGENSGGKSEWDDLVYQHKLCEKKVADNELKIDHLDKQIKEVRQMLVKENEWSVGFVRGANPTSHGASCAGPSSCSLDISKIYKTFFAFKFDMKR